MLGLSNDLISNCLMLWQIVLNLSQWTFVEMIPLYQRTCVSCERESSLKFWFRGKSLYKSHIEAQNKSVFLINNYILQTSCPPENIFILLLSVKDFLYICNSILECIGDTVILLKCCCWGLKLRY